MIDPRVTYVGVSALRDLNAEKLREFAASDRLIVIGAGPEEISVLVPYAMFVDMSAELLTHAKAEGREP